MAKKNKIIQNLRIETELYDKILKAIEKLNEKSQIEFKLSDFRRLALEFYASAILSENVNFEFTTHIQHF